jgi:hypothetical protein
MVAIGFDPASAVGNSYLLQNNLAAKVKGVAGKQPLCAPVELTLDSSTTCHLDLLEIDAQGGYWYPDTPIRASVPCLWSVLDAKRIHVDFDNVALASALELYLTDIKVGAGAAAVDLTISTDSTTIWPRADLVRSPSLVKASGSLSVSSAVGTSSRIVKFTLGQKAPKGMPAEGAARDWSTPLYLECPSGSSYGDDGYGGSSTVL